MGNDVYTSQRASPNQWRQGKDRQSTQTMTTWLACLDQDFVVQDYKYGIELFEVMFSILVLFFVYIYLLL